MSYPFAEIEDAIGAGRSGKRVVVLFRDNDSWLRRVSEFGDRADLEAGVTLEYRHGRLSRMVWRNGGELTVLTSPRPENVFGRTADLWLCDHLLDPGMQDEIAARCIPNGFIALM